jgi:hypothetical protein
VCDEYKLCKSSSMQLCQVCRYFLHLRPIFLSQHLILEHPQPSFLP